MTSGGWHSQEQRHGRHRQGATGAAWTPVVRPTDTGPAHAVRDGSVPVRPMDTAPPVSEVLMRRPGWPEDPAVPAARRAAEIGRAWPPQRQWRPAYPTDPVWPGGHPAVAGRERQVPAERPGTAGPERGVAAKRVWPDGSAVGPERPGTARQDRLRPETPAAPQVPAVLRRTVSTSMDAAPRARGRDEAVVYALPETTATGLRKFDLGNVPASVTPPRSWRRAAWFAVGTSAAVVFGLTVAAAELMGRPVSDDTIIDALPEYPTGPLTLEKLPDHDTTHAPPSKPTSRGRPTTPSGTPVAPRPQEEVTSRDTVTGGTTTTDGQTSDSPSQDTTTTTPVPPSRKTVGPAPVMPTDPQAMGDRTEEYFRLVTADPAGAHAMCTGSMAREGAEGIEARYGAIRRVEVQDITIDRNQAITTSTVKIVREDGTETIEHRRLTFTWGGDPKITEDATTQ